MTASQKQEEGDGDERSPTAAGDADRSLGQLVASATAEMSALVHDEIALAKARAPAGRQARRAIGGGAFMVGRRAGCSSRCRC